MVPFSSLQMQQAACLCSVNAFCAALVWPKARHQKCCLQPATCVGHHLSGEELEDIVERLSVCVGELSMDSTCCWYRKIVHFEGGGGGRQEW